MTPPADQSAADLPPRPFSYTETVPTAAHRSIGHVFLLDANGHKIASLWSTAKEKIALAELIIRASEAAK